METLKLNFAKFSVGFQKATANDFRRIVDHTGSNEGIMVIHDTLPFNNAINVEDDSEGAFDDGHVPTELQVSKGDPS